MKNILYLFLLSLFFYGCDVHRGPSLVNPTDTVLGIELEKSDGSVLRSELKPKSLIPLGGPEGGKRPSFDTVRIYDSTHNLLKEIDISGYDENDTILIDL